MDTGGISGGDDTSDDAAGETIRVLLLEDCAITRRGLKAVFQDYAGIEVIAEADDYDCAIGQISRMAPDVVVLSALGGSLEPSEAIQRLTGACPQWPARILVIGSTKADAEFDVSNGTVGTLLKSASSEELIAALRMVAAGYSLSPSCSSRWKPVHQPAEMINAAQASDQLESLTPREYDVLRLLARGRTNAEISTALVLSESTVKSHVQNVLNKLGTRNRVSAAIYAYETGIVQIGENRAFSAPHKIPIVVPQKGNAKAPSNANAS